MTVYLLHFDQPYRHAQHYIGVTLSEGLTRRLEEHRTGRGANLTRVIRRAGITFQPARTWEGVPRRFELRLKGRSARPLCPICRGASS